MRLDKYLATYTRMSRKEAKTAIKKGRIQVDGECIKKEDYNIISVIGDGALTGGMALEALDHAGSSKTKLIIVLNDNEMSISQNNGGLNNLLGHLRGKRLYTRTNNLVKRGVSKLPKIGPKIVSRVQRIKMSMKQLLLRGNGMFFEDIGFGLNLGGDCVSEIENIFVIL